MFFCYFCFFEITIKLDKNELDISYQFFSNLTVEQATNYL